MALKIALRDRWGNSYAAQLPRVYFLVKIATISTIGRLLDMGTKTGAGSLETKAQKSLSNVEFFPRSWEESWTYIKTVVDVVREPILILNKDFCVIAANESFYKTFQVTEKETTKKHVYELGNGQWNIPSLRKLLEDVLPKNTFFKGFEVAHEFPSIGRKVMLLNARRIYREHATYETSPPIILLAMEDVTEMMVIAKTLSDHANRLQGKLAERTEIMESHIGKLEKEIQKLRKDALKPIR